jgi:hypothetical protein
MVSMPPSVGARPGCSAPKTFTYVCLPPRLLLDGQRNPLAVGVYSLIARLYLIHQSPIPLSAPDLQRYDPTLSYGAARGALRRLVQLGWLTETTGHKNAYLPTWGRIRGAIRPWQIGAPGLGCPVHHTPLRLDRRLLDVLMGKLEPHPTHPAAITRYLDRPLLGLRDVGAYALTLAGYGGATERLQRYCLVCDGQAQPLPSDHAMLALASQWLFAEDGADLSIQGQRMLGIAMHAQAPHTTPDAQPLFFVAPSMIADLIPSLIPDLIVSEPFEERGASATRCGRTPAMPPAQTIPGTHRNLTSQGTSPPPPPAGGGGMQLHANEVQKPPLLLQGMETETAQLLRGINVMSSNIAKYAHLAPELVRAAIAHGRARPEVRDLAGWVVHLLGQASDGRWTIPSIAPNATSWQEDDIAALSRQYGDLFRLGSDEDDQGQDITSADDTMSELVIELCNAVRAQLPQRCWLPLDDCLIQITTDRVCVVCPNRQVWCAVWDLQEVLRDALRDLDLPDTLVLRLAEADDVALPNGYNVPPSELEGEPLGPASRHWPFLSTPMPLSGRPQRTLSVVAEGQVSASPSA